MQLAFVVLLVPLTLSACWVKSTAPRQGPSSSPVPRIRFDLSAIDLADDDILARISTRVNVRRCGRYRLDSSLPLRVPDHPEVAVRDLPVIGMDKDFVGLVIDDGRARFVLWCDSHGITQSVVVPVEINADSDLKLSSEFTLLPGIDIQVEASPTGNSVRVDSAVSSGKKIGGWIPRAVVGPVWLKDHESPATHVVASGAILYGDSTMHHELLSLPNGGARAMVSRRSQTFAQIVAEFDGIRVRGYVSPDALRLLPPAKPVAHGKELEEQPGASDNLPSGVCLYAGGTDTVLGVTTSNTLRPHATPILGFWSVYLSTPWGQVELIARDQSMTRRPASAKWDLCKDQ